RLQHTYLTIPYTTLFRSIVFVVEQGRDLEIGELIVQLLQIPVGLFERIGVTLLLGHLDEQLGIVDALTELLELVQGALLVGEPGRSLLRRIRVVPEGRRRRLLRELSDFVAQIVQVGHVENRFVRLAEVCDFSRVSRHGHNAPILVHGRPAPRTKPAGACPRASFRRYAAGPVRPELPRARWPKYRGRRLRSGCSSPARRVRRGRGEP